MTKRLIPCIQSRPTPRDYRDFTLELAAGIEPACAALQAAASPLGHTNIAGFPISRHLIPAPGCSETRRAAAFFRGE
jgi:hypothetical protein